MLPALLLCYCRIIKQAGSRGSSFLPALPQLSPGERGRRACAHIRTQIQTPREAAAFKTPLDIWFIPGFWSAHVAKQQIINTWGWNQWFLDVFSNLNDSVNLQIPSHRKSEDGRDKHIILYFCTQRLPMTCSSRGKECSRTGFPELLGDLQHSPEFSHSDFIQM